MLSANHYERRRFWTLIIIVSISGFSQGMLLPVISVIFETDGVSSTLNGLNATGLYIGTLLISPFIEQPLRRFGYKPIIIVGGAIVFLSLLMFPFWENIMFWFILRLLIGIGDHCLHFSTQTWLTTSAPEGNLGKSMSIYGLSFGVGFAAGPLMLNLVGISETLPFVVSSILCLIAWSFVFFIRNEKPEALKGDNVEANGLSRYKMSFKYAWVAFLPSFVYGVLETSLNALFPVYALRMDFKDSMISMILAAFSIGAIITQIPIGIIGDKIGRRKVILIGIFSGAVLFARKPAGAFSSVGSLYFLSIRYVPRVIVLIRHYLYGRFNTKRITPTGNLLCGIFFSLGSLTGPFIGGLYLELVDSISFLLFIAIMLFLIYLIILLFGKLTLPKSTPSAE